jgi:iron complex outermembrane receptor protein
MLQTRFLLAAAILAAASPPVPAADTAPATELQQITVYAPQPDGTSLGGVTITQQEIQLFNRNTLDEALPLASGTSTSIVGARNESNIWIRGFDRWRVPLYQDGIPIYLPVDNRIDFGRFTTADLGEIQISKGFASVIDGPGAMGGSINLVSRIVNKPMEGEARVVGTLDSTGSLQGWTTDVFAGSNQGKWFAQGAGSFASQSYFRLSDAFSPGTFQGPGDRIQSQQQDYKINLKAGYTPAPGAEYALNFIDQEAYKGNPVVDGIVPPAALRQVRYWDWPSWDKTSIYWLSKNEIDDRGSYIKTRLYYDRFYNQLDSFDTIAYSTQLTPKSFNSTYDDRAAGASIELSKTMPGGADTVRAAVHFRWDQHNETESTVNAPGAPFYQQPWEPATESTSSLALENIYHPTAAWDVIAGVSYDYRDLISARQFVAQGVTPPYGYTINYPVADKDAWNGEIAGVYRYSAEGSVHFSYADRSRFPTLFEMYSTRFGTFQNNPDLQPERSHYTQAGIADTIQGTRIVANIFYARVVDSIVAVPLTALLSENQNIGEEHRYGYEIELSRQFLQSLDAGLNYSDLVREILAGNTVATDTPRHKFFAYLDWRPIEKLSIVPSIDIESKRWLQSAFNNNVYYEGASFTMLNLKISYQFLPQALVEVGSTNLSDRNYLIEDNYHAPGRQYFANVRVKF